MRKYPAPLPNIVERHPEAYSIVIARYAKGKYIISPRDSADGYKGGASYAADQVGAKWVNRSHGYTASPAQVRRFEENYHAYATPSFDRWLSGYPVRTHSLADILTPLCIQVITEAGLQCVAYTQGAHRVRTLILGDTLNAASLYSAAVFEFPATA